jgi:hypothetical protein
LGSAAKDIDAEWSLLVVKAYQVKGPAATSEFSVPGAPESIVRTAPTSKGNFPSMISTVTVLRFPGRYVSVLFNASHAEAVEACKSDAAVLFGGPDSDGEYPAVVYWLCRLAAQRERVADPRAWICARQAGRPVVAVGGRGARRLETDRARFS